MQKLDIIKIISGGQTGADQAGLRAAKKLGIPTGGWIPKGFKTEEGNKPSLEILYGLAETVETDYKKRTYLNVKESDGTIIFAEKDSRGSILTQNICRRLGKPYWINPGVDEIRMFVIEYELEVINIAGNRETISPGIGERVENLLIRAIGDGS